MEKKTIVKIQRTHVVNIPSVSATKRCHRLFSFLSFAESPSFSRIKLLCILSLPHPTSSLSQNAPECSIKTGADARTASIPYSLVSSERKLYREALSIKSLIGTKDIHPFNALDLRICKIDQADSGYTTKGAYIIARINRIRTLKSHVSENET